MGLVCFKPLVTNVLSLWKAQGDCKSTIHPELDHFCIALFSEKETEHMPLIFPLVLNPAWNSSQLGRQPESPSPDIGVSSHSHPTFLESVLTHTETEESNTKGKEKDKVLDTLTKVLVALYEEPEKPNSALDFLKHHLGAATPENPEIELLCLELAKMKEQYEAIVEENKKLKAKLAQDEPPQEEKRTE
ncbi:hypothetical protein P7K49_000387 [Saguinus oedipus]|uniref:c-Myc-binding protein n=1 Tax=Saguinus oedipus TaxID=9490 RepID=A0ABQ9WCD1_SAGOE|nr:hypothetical protein P7K49_000387 [Saguinus oedipus]